MALKIGLVLGGGGSLGICHVGVLEILEKNNITPCCIVGTSMGAVVGGVYASGASNISRIKDSCIKLRTKDLPDFNLNLKGLFQGRTIEKLIKNHIGDINIEDFKIPFCAVACNLLNGEQVNISSGNAYRGIRASMSVPGLFTPIEYDGMVLIDGGVVDNVPIDVIESMCDLDLIIAVNAYNRYEIKSAGNLISVMKNAHLITTYTLSKHMLKSKVPLLLVEPKVSYTDQFAFKKENSLESIEAGRIEMEKLMPKLNEMIAKIEKKKNNK